MDYFIQKKKQMNLKSEFDEFWEQKEKITSDQLYLIENLINQIHLDKLQHRRAELFIHQNPTQEDAEQFIYWLESLRVDPINAGYNYSQTQIKNKLRNEID